MFMSIKICTHPTRFGTKNMSSSGMSLKFYKNLFFCIVVTLLVHNSIVTHKGKCMSQHNNCLSLCHTHVCSTTLDLVHKSDVTISCVVMLLFIQTLWVL